MCKYSGIKFFTIVAIKKMSPLLARLGLGRSGFGFGKRTAVIIRVTGGNVSALEPGNGYKYHTFTSPGTFTVSGTPNITAEILVVAGGGGGFTGGSGAIVSPEERKRRSERMKGITRPRWIYDKIAASNTGKKASAETRAKLSVIHKGKTCTEEHKRNVSKAKASPHKITFADGREIIVENLMDYARENNHHFSGLYNVKLGYTKRCKNIIKVERVDLT